jgi:hypothetical protein
VLDAWEDEVEFARNCVKKGGGGEGKKERKEKVAIVVIAESTRRKSLRSIRGFYERELRIASRKE